MIIGCVSFFNEISMLPGALLSLSGICDNIIAVDGAYKPFEHTTPYSTDGSWEYATKILGAGAVIKCEKAYESEAEKRSQYFIGGHGDWYIILDADERLVGWRLLRDELAVEDRPWLYIDVERYDLDPPNTQPTPRIIRHIDGLKYVGIGDRYRADGLGRDHSWLYRDDQQDGWLRYAGAAKILHVRCLRSKERLDQESRYVNKISSNGV